MIFKFLFFISVGHFGPALVVGQENGRHEHTLTSNAVSATRKPKVWDLIFDHSPKTVLRLNSLVKLCEIKISTKSFQRHLHWKFIPLNLSTTRAGFQTQRKEQPKVKNSRHFFTSFSHQTPVLRFLRGPRRLQQFSKVSCSVLCPCPLKSISE